MGRTTVPSKNTDAAEPLKKMQNSEIQNASEKHKKESPNVLEKRLSETQVMKRKKKEKKKLF